MTFMKGLSKVGQWFAGMVGTLAIGWILLIKTDAIATQKSYEEAIDNAATKEELSDVKEELQTEIKDTESELREEIKQGDNAVKSILEEHNRLHSEVSQGIVDIKADLREMKSK